jgi:hypothetical protein
MPATDPFDMTEGDSKIAIATGRKESGLLEATE